MHVENTKFLKVPVQGETVSYPPPLVFDNALIYDEGNEEEENEVSDVLIPSCYDEDNNFVDNFDEFIHVGRSRWDLVGYDMGPVYDIESHFQVFPLKLSQHTILHQWQQGDEIFTHTLQKPKDDPTPCFPNDFWSYLEDFDDCSSENLNLFYEDDYQPLLYSDFDTSKNIVCLKKVSHDFSLQPPIINLP
jgi:hypothetical protein